MQTFIFISWCLLFDVLFAAAGVTICTDLKNLQNTFAGLMCRVIITAGRQTV